MKNVSVNFGCYSFDNIRHIEIFFGGRNSLASHKNSAPPYTKKFGEASSSSHYNMHYLERNLDQL